MMQEIAADAFEKIGAAHHRVDTSRHPAMHKTETIDYIILLKGDVTLILDEEEAYHLDKVKGDQIFIKKPGEKTYSLLDQSYYDIIQEGQASF